MLLLQEAGLYSSVVESARETYFMDDRWLERNGVDLKLLASAIETLLQARQVSQGVAKALASGSLRSYLEALNGKPNLQVPSNKFCTQALSILLDDLAHVAEIAEINHVSIFLDDFYYLVTRTPVIQRTALERITKGRGRAILFLYKQSIQLGSRYAYSNRIYF